MSRDEEYQRELELEKAQGRAEGRAEGRAPIIKFIKNSRLMHQSEDHILQSLISLFEFSIEEARELLETIK